MHVIIYHLSYYIIYYSCPEKRKSIQVKKSTGVRTTVKMLLSENMNINITYKIISIILNNKLVLLFIYLLAH